MAKKIKTPALLFTAILISVNLVWAKENIGSSGKTSVSLKTLAAGCTAASHQVELNINNVRTTLLDGGDLWWDLNDAKYEIPKVEPGPNAPPSVHSIFAGAIWLGGIDAGGQLKIAAQTYRQSGNDFWPGPLDANGTITESKCQDYDWHWKVLATDIEKIKAAYANGNVSDADVAESINTWPAKGNNNATGSNNRAISVGNQDLAPFFDQDGDGIYDPKRGDHPVISSDFGDVYADQMIFWVYNDKGNIHTETGGQAIGVQVNALAFAFTTSDEVNDMTFYRYKIINKATLDIRKFYMGQWVDPDLGCFTNDYVGCDTSRGLGICYNGTATDPDCATRGYGADPPLVGVDYFEGPFADINFNDSLNDPAIDGKDNDGDGLIDYIADPDERKKLGMSAFVYYNNDFTVTGNPESAVHYYNYLTGFWKDNTPFTSDQCTGYGGSVPAKHMFPSSPNLSPFPQFWSECSCGNTPADRRFLQSSGPFTLTPGSFNNITVGVVWARPKGFSCASGTFESTIGLASDKAQALFDNHFKLVDGPDAPTLNIRELDKEIIISLTNDKSSNNFNESYDEIDPFAVTAKGVISSITDTTYTFQGYKLYQLKNAQVSASDLDDITKARLVAQVDIKDTVSKIVNFEFDQNIELDVPVLKVDGANDGVKRTFKITEDLFATGIKTLVNHKTYYFTAVAYAYNNYKKYNVTDPILKGQEKPYLQGRRNFKTYSAIPHIPDAGLGGTVLRAQYGDGLEITRLDGKGNGGLNLDLKEESVNEILSSGNSFYDHIVYKSGRGPVDVKVYDPMNLKEADFTFVMMDTCDPTLGNCPGPQDDFVVHNNGYWRIDVLNEDGSTDTIWADRSIASKREQLVENLKENYGLSISLGQVTEPGRSKDDPKGFLIANGLIESTMDFEDPEYPWLTGLKDDATFEPSNWIRSGQYRGNEDDGLEEFFDDYAYVFPGPIGTGRDSIVFWDPNQVFEGLLNGTFAPYALSANRVNKRADFLEAEAAQNGEKDPYSYGPAFPIRFRATFNSTTSGTNFFDIPTHTLDILNSVDLVMTNDKSKWTRCVVVELGEDSSLTQGHAMKGQIRNALSWDKNGSYLSADTGRSWFPGYAINIETGERLNIVFGEDSWLVGENGRDMIWNPTSNDYSPLDKELFGGKHYIYILNTRYDEGAALQRVMLDNFNKFPCQPCSPSNNPVLKADTLNKYFYTKIMWVSMAFVQKGYKLKSVADGIVPNDVKVRLRVNVPYAKFAADNTNNGLPKYFFSTRGLSSQTEVVEVAKDACDMIRAVPNPYYAYSSYETSQLDNRIKITNLPDRCTISIYTLGGTLIRKFERAVGEDTSTGTATSKTNLDNSIDWDLKNNKNIQISSGVYLIHVKADGVCEKVIKWFGAMRPIDLDTF